jgi:hypothetical protein
MLRASCRKLEVRKKLRESWTLLGALAKPWTLGGNWWGRNLDSGSVSHQRPKPEMASHSHKLLSNFFLSIDVRKYLVCPLATNCRQFILSASLIDPGHGHGTC